MTPQNPPPSRARVRWAAALVALWAIAMVAAMVFMWRYKLTPGAAPRLEARWPAGTRIPLAADRPTLIMFAHPRCPCTRASLAELRGLLPRVRGDVAAYVLFLHAGGTSEGWSHTDTWAAAKDIPGVQVLQDDDGATAAAFGAVTSGHVIVYAPTGALLFSGGITSARGHMGDNELQDRLFAALTAATAAPTAATPRTAGPVFGCPLEDPR